VAVVLGGASRILALAVRPGRSAGLDRAGLEALTVERELADRLPSHMLPRTVVVLDTLPLTANGKIDRPVVTRLVAEAAGADSDGDSDETGPGPRTPLEQVVAMVWREVLERDRIGVEQSLFSAGGDSVLATVIVARLRELLDTAEVSVRMMFGAPTVAGLAAAMTAASSDPQRLAAVAEIVLEVHTMSDDEVAHELAAPVEQQ
ncbi:MAG TPA: phosphopantetheine-binding protein, partial [Pseudonocardia sp.]